MPTTTMNRAVMINHPLLDVMVKSQSREVISGGMSVMRFQWRYRYQDDFFVAIEWSMVDDIEIDHITRITVKHASKVVMARPDFWIHHIPERLWHYLNAEAQTLLVFHEDLVETSYQITYPTSEPIQEAIQIPNHEKWLR